MILRTPTPYYTTHLRNHINDSQQQKHQNMSSAFMSGNGESFVIDTNKSVRQLYPNQFYKICVPISPSSRSATTSSSSSSWGSAGIKLGSDPICGDGTQFCFYFTRPPQKSLNGDRLIIELMGGGACWDADTCEQQADYLAVSGDLDEALGRSCQEVQAGVQGGGGQGGGGGNGGKAVNMLCSGSLGGTDLTKYNTVIVPYCTQDVHIGDRAMTYNDGSTVYHHGAHNIINVLQWVYKNFPRLQHAIVTGCSAGGTAVPIVQALLDKQYNHFGSRQLQTAVIADSPVYLTPQYFLKNGLKKWNPQSILFKLGLPYQRFASSTEYPTRMWDFILRKGNNKDRWGFVSHTSDPVSLIYYEYMAGYYVDNDDDGNNYNDNYNNDDANNNNDDGNNANNDDAGEIDYESLWYSELTESVSYIQSKHRNVDTYWIDSEGHCTFGLYYGISEGGSDFESFVAPIIKEDKMFVRPAVNAFLLSSALGCGLILVLLYNRRRRIFLQHDDSNGSDGVFGSSATTPTTMPKITNFNSNLTVASTSTTSHWATFKSKALSIMQTWESYPVTVGYMMCISVYFLFMICQQGFAHPMNNPSLGPNALGLSKFGILNPSLVVYQGHWFRLLTTNFVVSGVITYIITILYLLFRTRPLETKIGTDFMSPWLFVTIAVLVASFTNFVYCFVPTRFGASCTSLAMLMGLQAFHLLQYRNTFVRPYLSIAALVFDLFVVSFIFPFNSWIMMVTGIFGGLVLSAWSKSLDEFLPGGIKIHVSGASIGKNLQSEIELFGQHSTEEEDESSVNYETMDDRHASHVVMNKQRKKRTKIVFCAFLAFSVSVLVPLLIAAAASPRRIYEDSFYTGCKLFYSDQLDDLSSSFLSDDDNVDHENRDGEEGGDHRRSLQTAYAGAMFRFLDGVSEMSSRRRRIEAGGGHEVDYSCAQFCVPHLISPLFQTVARNRGLPVQRGQCTEHGYTTHVLDKTFSGLSYSLDVELYSSNNNNNGENNNRN